MSVRTLLLLLIQTCSSGKVTPTLQSIQKFKVGYGTEVVELGSVLSTDAACVIHLASDNCGVSQSNMRALSLAADKYPDVQFLAILWSYTSRGTEFRCSPNQGFCNADDGAELTALASKLQDGSKVKVVQDLFKEPEAASTAASIFTPPKCPGECGAIWNMFGSDGRTSGTKWHCKDSLITFTKGGCQLGHVGPLPSQRGDASPKLWLLNETLNQQINDAIAEVAVAPACTPATSEVAGTATGTTGTTAGTTVTTTGAATGIATGTTGTATGTTVTTTGTATANGAQDVEENCENFPNSPGCETLESCCGGGSGGQNISASENISALEGNQSIAVVDAAPNFQTSIPPTLALAISAAFA